jgi:hypothetical protein
MKNMHNLLKTYIDLFSDSQKWKYYSDMDVNPFTSTESSREFITRFIELSGKAQNNSLFENIYKLDDKRIQHIVSIFFLGTHIYYNNSIIKTSIDKVINRFKNQNKGSKIEFSFIWFLICLFHDLGYEIEDNEKYKDFDEFIKGKVKYFLNESVGVPKLYEDTFKQYFNYRLKSDKVYLKKPDHGICGGILLFNKLNTILIKKQKNNRSEGLSWNKKLINIYRYASWVILAHNMFYIRTGDPDEHEYLRNDLGSLILDKDEKPKINLEKHSFLYLFLLVDSIDPIKTFDKYENLTNIRIETSSSDLRLVVNNKDFRDQYFKKVESLKEWLVPEIKISQDTIIIKIKNNA